MAWHVASAAVAAVAAAAAAAAPAAGGLKGREPGGAGLRCERAAAVHGEGRGAELLGVPHEDAPGHAGAAADQGHEQGGLGGLRGLVHDADRKRVLRKGRDTIKKEEKKGQEKDEKRRTMRRRRRRKRERDTKEWE
jgi:hypothetical protein